MRAMWHDGLLEAASICDVSRRGLGIRVSSAVGLGAQRERKLGYLGKRVDHVVASGDEERLEVRHAGRGSIR